MLNLPRRGLWSVSRQTSRWVSILAVAVLLITALRCTMRTPTSTATPTPSGPPPSIQISPTKGGSGTLIEVTGGGWQPGDTVFINLQDPAEGGPSMAYAAAPATTEGAITASFVFPSDPRWAGLPLVMVTGRSSAAGTRAWVSFQVLVPTVVPTVAALIPTATPEPPTQTPEPPVVTPEPTTQTPEPTTPTVSPTATSVEPTPTQTPPANVALVLTEALNVRYGPDTLYPVISTVQRGTSLTVLGQDSGGDWLYVRLPDDTTGWISRAFTDFTATAPWAPTPVPPTPVPTAAIEGWRGEYYDNLNLTGTPAFVRSDRTIKFNWGTAAPSADLPVDAFSVRWSRQIYFPAGLYEFFVSSDDGVRIWFDGTLTVDQWHDADGATYSMQHALGEGVHSLRVEYYEHQGMAEIEFWWERMDDFPQWRGAYFPNTDLIGDPALVRNDEKIDFDWGNGAPAAGLAEDRFSVRWTRTLYFTEGQYSFHALVDDGVRLYVDGYLVLDDWRDGGQREVKVEQKLADGSHSVRIEYYERTGKARILVWWQKIYDYPDWRAEYWSNRKLEGMPKLVRNDRRIDFNWDENSPSPGVPADGFSVRWSRKVDFQAGTYRFYALADDGIRFYIDGRLVLDEWQDSDGSTVYEVDQTLKKGSRQLVVEYYERTGEARVKFWWESVSITPTSTATATPTMTLTPTATATTETG